MKKQVKDQSSRRKFLSLGLMGSAGLLSGQAAAILPSTEEEETISMLTPDGKLVQVSKKILEKSENRIKARNEDILNWSETHNKSKS